MLIAVRVRILSIKVCGVVLKENITRESDRVITVLTNSGIVRAYAKAAKNIKSKKFTATSPLCYSEFVLREGGDLYIVNSAEEIEIFYNLRNDIERLSLAQYFCELLSSVAPEETDCEEILRLTLNSLHFLCSETKSIYLVKSVFEMRLMCLLGFMPDLVACKGCAKFEDNTVFFDVFDSSIYCAECLPQKPGNYIKIGLSELSVLRHIVYSEFNKIFGFSASNESLRAVSSLCERYVEAMVERRFRTLDYFNSVRI